MKKLRPYMKWMAMAGGVLAGGLRQWTLSAGENSQGLFPANHPGWIGYLLLSAVVVALFWWLSRQKAAEAVPPRGTVYLSAVAALGLIVYNFSALQNANAITLVACLLGFAAAAALLLDIQKQRKSAAPFSAAFALPCLYFALEIFLLNQTFSGETELLRFIPQILALAAGALACYQLWGKSVGLDSANKRLFWQCCAGYLCIAAAAGCHIMYACVGLWLLFRTDALPVQEQP